MTMRDRRGGLRDLGYPEGKHCAIEYRGAEGKLEPVPESPAGIGQTKIPTACRYRTRCCRVFDSFAMQLHRAQS